MLEGADKNRYKITVEGTGIREYYQLDENLPEDQVAEKWLNDAASKWGEGIAIAFSGRVQVEQIAKKHEPPALPPCNQAESELTEERT